MSTTDWVGIYGAVVATVVLAKDVFIYTRDNLSTLFIDPTAMKTLNAINNLMEDARIFNLPIEIINRGNKVRYINQPFIQLPKNFDLAIVANLLNRSVHTEFPRKLEAGETFVYDFNYEYLKLIKEKNRSKLRIVVTDSHGKKHFSRKFNL